MIDYVRESLETMQCLERSGILSVEVFDKNGLWEHFVFGVRISQHTGRCSCIRPHYIDHRGCSFGQLHIDVWNINFLPLMPIMFVLLSVMNFSVMSLSFVILSFKDFSVIDFSVMEFIFMKLSFMDLFWVLLQRGFRYWPDHLLIRACLERWADYLDLTLVFVVCNCVLHFGWVLVRELIHFVVASLAVGDLGTPLTIINETKTIK